MNQAYSVIQPSLQLPYFIPYKYHGYIVCISLDSSLKMLLIGTCGKTIEYTNHELFRFKAIYDHFTMVVIFSCDA